jgi:hydrogenase nickel incorporation protein HypA/HybF
MHELSLAQSLVETVCEALPGAGGGRVVAVNLKVGELAGVVPDALQFCYEVVTKDTPLAGSTLTVRTLPVMVFCAPCDRPVEIELAEGFRCPVCRTPSSDLRQGREIEVESVELVDDAPEEVLS